MKVYISLLCKCGLRMSLDKGVDYAHVRCVNHKCDEFNIEYEAPTIKLKEAME
jgi:hypothetical protein